MIKGKPSDIFLEMCEEAKVSKWDLSKVKFMLAPATFWTNTGDHLVYSPGHPDLIHGHRATFSFEGISIPVWVGKYFKQDTIVLWKDLEEGQISIQRKI